MVWAYIVRISNKKNLFWGCAFQLFPPIMLHCLSQISQICAEDILPPQIAIILRLSASSAGNASGKVSIWGCACQLFSRRLCCIVSRRSRRFGQKFQVMLVIGPNDSIIAEKTFYPRRLQSFYAYLRDLREMLPGNF
jgi:hypothetical protein